MTTPTLQAGSTRIYRLVHIGSLEAYLRRQGLHAPNCAPDDGLEYRSIHRQDVQSGRQTSGIPCGPGGAFLDYVPFYFCPRSVMLYQLHTGWVPGYSEGQEPLIHLVSSVQRVQSSGAHFVFSDGHGLAAMTRWYDDLEELDALDWNVISGRMWQDTPDEPDRKRRKQAEFLVHRLLDWEQIIGIGVASSVTLERVQSLLDLVGPDYIPPALILRDWYY